MQKLGSAIAENWQLLGLGSAIVGLVALKTCILITKVAVATRINAWITCDLRVRLSRKLRIGRMNDLFAWREADLACRDPAGRPSDRVRDTPRSLTPSTNPANQRGRHPVFRYMPVTRSAVHTLQRLGRALRPDLDPQTVAQHQHQLGSRCFRRLADQRDRYKLRCRGTGPSPDHAAPCQDPPPALQTADGNAVPCTVRFLGQTATRPAFDEPLPLAPTALPPTHAATALSLDPIPSGRRQEGWKGGRVYLAGLTLARYAQLD